MTPAEHKAEAERISVRTVLYGVALVVFACTVIEAPWLALAASVMLVVGVVVLLWRRRPAHAVAFGAFAGLAVVVTLWLVAADELEAKAAAVAEVER